MEETNNVEEVKFEPKFAYPGCIIDVNDPKKIGRVKCEVPTVFDSSVMDKEGLPWVYPFIQPGYQRYSAPIEGQKVWVFEPRPQEYWYWPMVEFSNDTNALLTDENYSTAEILFTRTLGNMSAKAYYTKSDGIMLKIGDTSSINIDNNGEVKLIANKAKVVLKGDHVYIGDGEQGQPTILGDNLYKLLEELSNKLKITSDVAAASPYTMTLAIPLYYCASAITDLYDTIKTTNTRVN